MKKKVKMRREFSRKSDIDCVIENTDRLFENDIVSAFKIGKDSPRVTVQYGEEIPLNQPCVRLEDIPTDSTNVDSPLSAMQSQIESSLRDMDNTDNEEVKQENE